MRPVKSGESWPRIRLDAELDLSEAMVRMICLGEKHALVVREDQIQGQVSLYDMFCQLGLSPD